MKSTYYKIISASLMALMTTTLAAYSQTNQTAPAVENAVATQPVDNDKPEKDADKGIIRKATGTVLTANSKPIPIPSYNVEIMDIDGRKITVIVHGYENGGVKIQTTDGRNHVVAWNRLSWESVAKLTGQELSYSKAGMDAQWLQAGPPKCSRSR